MTGTTLRGIVGLLACLGSFGNLTEARDRKITIKNSCKQRICPAITQKDSPAMLTLPAELGGGNGPFLGFCLEANVGQTELNVPNKWGSTRLWGRTGCDDKTGKCITGDCGNDGKGNFGCTGGGEPPVSLAEWTLAMPGEKQGDNYDVSLVDGFNVPMSLHTTDERCVSSYCEKNINLKCPDALRMGIDSEGKNEACYTACSAGIAVGEWKNTSAPDPNLLIPGSMSCCNGPFDTLERCPKQCIDYYSLYHDRSKRWLACYSDEQGLKACTSSEAQPDYFLEFCAGEDKDILGNSGGVKDYEGDTADGSCMTDVSISEQWQFMSGFNPLVAVSNGKKSGEGQAGGKATTEAIMLTNPESTASSAGATSTPPGSSPQPTGDGAAAPEAPQPSVNWGNAGASSVQGEATVQAQGQQPDPNAGVSNQNQSPTSPAEAAVSTQAADVNPTSAAGQAGADASQGAEAPHNPGGPAASASAFVPVNKQVVDPDAPADPQPSPGDKTLDGVAGEAVPVPEPGETVVQKQDGSVGTVCHKRKKRGLLARDGLKKHKAKRSRKDF